MIGLANDTASIEGLDLGLWTGEFQCLGDGRQWAVEDWW